MQKVNSLCTDSRPLVGKYCVVFFQHSHPVVFSFSLFFVSMPCAKFGWPSRQLLSARKYTVSYRIVSYVGDPMPCNLVYAHLFARSPSLQ